MSSLLETLRHPYAHEELGPVFVAEADAVDRTNAEEVAKLVRSLPAVTVAVVEREVDRWSAVGVDAFDVTVTDSTALGELEAAVRATPQAAITLGQLLRLSEHRPLPDALIAESLAYATLQAGPEHAAWLDGRPAQSPDDAAGRPVTAEHRGSTLWLALDRPHRRNAYSAAMRDALVELLRLADADPSLDGLVLVGNGPDFCSGGDLAEFGTRPDPATAHLVRTTRSAAYWLDRLGERVRVHVHGACVGAGVELPSFAHSVVATPDATFRLPEIGMGLVPGAGGTVSIARRIGRQRLCAWALLGSTIDAPTALAWGLVDRVT